MNGKHYRRSKVSFDNCSKIWETFRKLDGSEAPDDLSSSAVRILTEIFVVSQLELYLRLIQMNRESKTSEKRISLKIPRIFYITRNKTFNNKRRTRNE